MANYELRICFVVLVFSLLHSTNAALWGMDNTKTKVISISLETGAPTIIGRLPTNYFFTGSQCTADPVNKIIYFIGRTEIYPRAIIGINLEHGTINTTIPVIELAAVSAVGFNTLDGFIIAVGAGLNYNPPYQAISYDPRRDAPNKILGSLSTGTWTYTSDMGAAIDLNFNDAWFHSNLVLENGNTQKQLVKIDMNHNTISYYNDTNNYLSFFYSPQREEMVGPSIGTATYSGGVYSGNFGLSNFSSNSPGAQMYYYPLPYNVAVPQCSAFDPLEGDYGGYIYGVFADGTNGYVLAGIDASSGKAVSQVLLNSGNMNQYPYSCMVWTDRKSVV